MNLLPFSGRFLRVAGTLSAVLLLTVGGCDKPVETESAASLAVSEVAVQLYLGPGGGSSRTVSAQLYGSSGSKLVGRPITWTTGSAAVATVSASGTVTAVGLGTTSLSVSSDGLTSTIGVTVSPVPVAAVLVSAPAASLVERQTAQLTVTLRDSTNATLSGRVVSYASSDIARAQVSASGLVTAGSPGAVTITAASEGRSGSVALTVLPIPAASVTVSPPSVSLIVGATTTLAPTVRDANNGVLTGRAVSWSSSDTTSVRVSATGVVSGVAVGSATVTASVEGRTAAVPVTVTPVPVARVIIGPIPPGLFPGATLQLVAGVADASNNPLSGRLVTWTSSDPSVARVTAAGVLTTVAAGTTSITATCEGVSAQATVTVAPVPIATLTVNPSTATLAPGVTQQMSATARDGAGNVLTGRPLSWSTSNASVASITPTGLVTALTAGTVTITGTSEGRTGTATITVSAPAAVETVAITPSTSLSVAINGTLQLTATTRDANNNVLTGRVVTWSSAQVAVATVDATTGVVTGRSAGSASITATSEGKTATVSVTVTPFPIVRVTAQPSTLAMTVGTTATITALAFDINATPTTARTFVWNIDNLSVASGAINGNVLTVSALAVGTATITVTVENITATVPLTVSAATAATVTLSPTQLSLEAGTIGGFTVIVRDANNNVLTNRPINWNASPGSIITGAALGQSYTVRTVGIGQGTVSATVDGKTATATVNVTAPTSSLNFATTSVTLTQVVQRPNNTVPLVAGRETLVSVYGTVNNLALLNGLVPRVRVRVYNFGFLLFEDTRSATGTIATTTSQTTPLHQLLIQGINIAPGISVTAEINPPVNIQIAEVFTGDNLFPSSGVPLPVTVKTMPNFDVRFVPIALAADNNATAPLTLGTLYNKYGEIARQTMPILATNYTVGATFSVNIPFSGGNLTTFWGPAFSQLDAKRVADGGTQIYYGVVPMPTGTNFASNGGIAYYPGRTAMGMTAEFGWSNPKFPLYTFAHEMGHVFGRPHAPCGNPANPDPNYPYAGAKIGVVGYDVYTFGLNQNVPVVMKDPAVSTDFMSYCYDWISDYTFEGMMNYRLAGSFLVAPSIPQQTLLVSGAESRGVVTLEPSYIVQTVPEMPSGTGPWVLEGLDAGGAVLFRYRFATKPIDHIPDVRHFAFALPITDAIRDRLVTVRAGAPGRATANRRSVAGRAAMLQRLATATGSAGGAVLLAAQRASGDVVRVQWDATTWSGVMVRDPDTNEVLAFGTGGTIRVHTTKRSLTLVLSDGTQSVTTAAIVR